MKTATRKASKTVIKTSTTNKTRVPKALAFYSGAPIPATNVYVKAMEGFSKKQGNACNAQAWMIVDHGQQTYTFANTYSDDNQPKASWNPAHYTYTIKEKVLAKKIEEYREIEDREEWPTWVQPAVRTKKPPRVRSSK